MDFYSACLYMIILYLKFCQLIGYKLWSIVKNKISTLVKVKLMELKNNNFMCKKYLDHCQGHNTGKDFVLCSQLFLSNINLKLFVRFL